MSGDFINHMSWQKLSSYYSQASSIRRFLNKYLWFLIFIELKSLEAFLASRKYIGEIFYKNNFTHRLFRSVSIFQPSFTNRAVLTSWAILISKPTLTLWTTYFSPTISGGLKTACDLILQLLFQKNLLLVLSIFFIRFGELKCHAY